MSFRDDVDALNARFLAASKRNDAPGACADAYVEAWRQGIKAVAIYRDGSKLSQPLQSQLIADEDEGRNVDRSGASR